MVEGVEKIVTPVQETLDKDTGHALTAPINDIQQGAETVDDHYLGHVGERIGHGVSEVADYTMFPFLAAIVWHIRSLALEHKLEDVRRLKALQMLDENSRVSSLEKLVLALCDVEKEDSASRECSMPFEDMHLKHAMETVAQSYKMVQDDTTKLKLQAEDSNKA